MIHYDWKPYTGEYEKEQCFIRLRDGHEFGPCWPNAGSFLCLMNKSVFCGSHIEGSKVTHIRYAKDEECFGG